MNSPYAFSKRTRGGFTRVEVAIVVLVVVALVGLLLISIAPARARRSNVNCRSRLLQIGSAFRSFANDNGDAFPMAVSTNRGGTLEYSSTPDLQYRHFQALSNWLGQTLYVICPKDAREPATNFHGMVRGNVSYFAGLDCAPKLPLSMLAGDRNITSASGVNLQWNPSSPPKWVQSVGLHGDKGNVLFSDGHVEELDSVGLSNALQRAGMPTNRFAVP